MLDAFLMGSKISLRHHQLVLLNELIVITKLLKANSIQYFFLGGSVLGAHRHHGFIPWDDDLDIGVYRHDYDKTELLIADFYGDKKNLFSFEHTQTNEFYRMPFATLRPIYDLLRSGDQVFPGIDIFPLDGVPSNPFLRFLQKIYARIYHFSILKKAPQNHGIFLLLSLRFFLALSPNWLLTKISKFSKFFLVNSSSEVSLQISFFITNFFSPNKNFLNL